MDDVAVLLTSAVAVLVGLLVLLGSAQRRIGWLLVAQGVCFGVLLLGQGSATSRPGMIVDQLASGSWVFLFLWLVVIAYLIPDGHALSSRWRRWMLAGLAGLVAFLVGSAGDVAGFREAHDGQDPPLRWLPEAVSGALGSAGLAVTVMFFVGAAFAVRARLKGSSGTERLQLLWLVWGATSLPLSLVLAWVGHFVLDDSPLVMGLALTLAGAALPVAIGIAILRHQLFDIRLVLSRTLTYGVLLIAVVSLYVVLLLIAQRVVGQTAAGGVFAVAIVAVAVQPVYSVARRAIERWVYGYRSDPTTALRRLGARLESADPLHVVDAVTASVRDALKVDRVWVAPPDTDEPPSLATVQVPLVHREELIGYLAVEAPRGRRLSAADNALLRDLARQAAVTVRAARLAEELQASRSSIVTAREEERKRLRRDLHDGVGPSLAAILLKVEAARSRKDATSRDVLLTEVRDETKAAIAEVRRAVDELRPPAIDELGLAGAIAQRASSLSTEGLVFEVQLPPALPSLPAAAEVAAFRIASEAMTNVARHSGATRCRVELRCDHGLELTVLDNGRGPGRESPRGIGWTSMVERAEELGGTCTIRARDGGGLAIHAILPVGHLVSTDDHPADAHPATAISAEVLQ
jgi:signal transduction histidine kinase